MWKIKSSSQQGTIRSVFKKYGEYADSIGNIVYNKDFMKKIIKKQIKFFGKKKTCVGIYKKAKY